MRVRERERERERKRDLFNVIGDNQNHKAKIVSNFTVYKTEQIILLLTLFLFLVFKFIMIAYCTLFTPYVI